MTRCLVERGLPMGVVALAATGCLKQPATPADQLSDELPAAPPAYVALPGRDSVVAAWQLPASEPWAAYVKLTLPAALDDSLRVEQLPDVAALSEVTQARCAARQVARAGLPESTAWVVDLRGAASVAFGAELSVWSGVEIVPTFNNWPAPNELVPAEETLAAMIAMPPRAPNPAAGRAPVFLLDAWRLAYKSETIDPSVVDNRYMLSAADLPSAEVLRAQGIDRVIYVVEDRSLVTAEEDDLNEIFRSYADAGIRLDMVDAGWLCGVDVVDDWDWWVELDGFRLSARPRVTVVNDARFYARAQGGFGGVRARPFAIAHPFVSGGTIGGRSFGGGIGGG